jgi:predicted nucleic acid-binding protein
MEPYLVLLLPVFRRVQRGEARIVVSVVTEAELLIRPLRHADQEALDRISDLLSEDGFQVVPVDRRIGRRAALLRANQNLRLADAIIAATAVETGCEAIVGNDGAFRRLTEIPFVCLDDLVASQTVKSAEEK